MERLSPSPKLRKRLIGTGSVVLVLAVVLFLLSSTKMPRGAEGYERARFTRGDSITTGPNRFTLAEVIPYDSEWDEEGRPEWPRSLADSTDWVHAIVVRFAEMPRDADVLEVRVFDSRTRERLREGVFTRWLSEEDLLVARHGETLPASMDLWMRVLNHEGNERWNLDLRPMSTATVPNGTIRMQQATPGLHHWDRRDRNFATMAPIPGGRQAADFTTVYVQWTSNRVSPLMSGTAVTREGDRIVFAPAEKFSTLDPLGLYIFRMRHHDLERIEWRPLHSVEPIVFRAISVPAPTSSIEAVPPLELDLNRHANRFAGLDWGAAQLSMNMRLSPEGTGFRPTMQLTVLGLWYEDFAVRIRNEEGELVAPERWSIARRYGAHEPEMAVRAIFPVMPNQGTIILTPSPEVITD